MVGNGDPDRPSRFSDIKLVGYRSIDSTSTTVHQGISIEGVVDFRVDHCSFEHIAGRAIGVRGLHCRGVIDHNQIYNIYGYDVLTHYTQSNIGYGVAVERGYDGVTFDPTMDV